MSPSGFRSGDDCVPQYGLSAQVPIAEAIVQSAVDDRVADSHIQSERHMRTHPRLILPETAAETQVTAARSSVLRAADDVTDWRSAALHATRNRIARRNLCQVEAVPADGLKHHAHTQNALAHCMNACTCCLACSSLLCTQCPVHNCDWWVWSETPPTERTISHGS